MKLTAKQIEFAVLVDIDAGFVNKTDVSRCQNLSAALSIYREMCDKYGKDSCKFFEMREVSL